MFNPKETLDMIYSLLKKKWETYYRGSNFIDWVDSWHDSLYLAHMQNFNLYSLNELMLKNDFSPTEVFYTKYKNKRKKYLCNI